MFWAPAGQRQAVRVDFEKDTNARTAKCKICGDRIRNFAHRCTHCRIRICSDCSELDGERSAQHKAVAADYMANGCWCGFQSGFNPAFSGRMPAVEREKKPSVEMTPVLKRKRGIGGALDNTFAWDDERAPVEPADESSTDDSSPLSSLESSPVQAPAEQYAEFESSAKESSSSQQSTSAASYGQRSSSTDDAAAVQHPPKIRLRYRHQTPGFHELPRSMKQQRSREISPSSQTRNTVIIGAGHIGLFIAYELAKKAANDSGSKHSVTVVEINDSPCELSSGHSAGLVTVQGMSEEWNPLLEAATTAWTELREDPEFSKAVEFSTRVAAITTEPGNARPTVSPPWLKLEPPQTLVSDCDMGGGTLCKVDIPQLTAFLQQRCKTLKVDFQYGMHLCKITRGRTGRMTGIQIKKPTVNSAFATSLACTELILATGPYTKDVFSTYFPETPLPLRNHAQRSEWLGVRHPVMRSQALVFPDERRPLTCPVSIIASAAEGTLRISTAQSMSSTQEVTVGDMFDEQRRMSHGMRELALRYIVPTRQTAPLGSGSALVGTANGRNPMLGKVPDEVRGDVWLCYGFGHHGTTLAPGVGKIMAEMVMGEESSADVSLFAVPKARQMGKAVGRI